VVVAHGDFAAVLEAARSRQAAEARTISLLRSGARTIDLLSAKSVTSREPIE
jgi:hypothetical protein